MKSPKALGSALLALVLNLAPVSALAGSSAQISINPAQPVQQLQLSGIRSQTLYRTEIYDTTCSRTESYTSFETQCRPVYDNQCSAGAPVCRDVMRPVCSSNGCQDFLTRECTPSAPICHQVRLRDDCRQVPVIRNREVAYSCQQSRQVPDGTELIEERITNVSIELAGDSATLSGRDAISVRVPNGIDVSDFSLDVRSAADAGTHLLYAEKIDENSRSLGDRRSELNLRYRVRAVEKEKVRGPIVKLESVDADSQSLALTLSGAPVDSDLRIHLHIEKKQVIGGWKTMVDTDLAASGLRIVDLGGGRTQASVALSALGFEYNRRPHRLTLSFVRDLTPSLSRNLLNPAILSGLNVRSEGSSSADVRFR